MGNGVKALLVALLVISVVVGAQFVQRDSEPEKKDSPETASTKSPETSSSKSQEAKSSSKPSTARSSRVVASSRRPGDTPGKGSSASRSTGGAVTTASRRSSPSTSPASSRADSRTPRTSSAIQSTPRQTTQLTKPQKSVPQTTGGSGAATAGQVSTSPTTGPNTVNVVAKGPGDGQGTDLKSSGGFVPQEPPRRTSPNIRPGSRTPRSSSAEFGPTVTTLDDVIRSSTSPTTTAAPSGPFNRPISSSGDKKQPAGSSRTATGFEAFPKVHEIGNGDSYWKLAEKYYGVGKGKHYKSIQKANNFAKLIPGKRVQIPAPPPEATRAAATVASKNTTTSAGNSGSSTGSTPSAASTSAASTSAASTSAARRATKSKDGRYYIHTVGKGDTLMDLAKEYYGNPRHFAPILDANRFLRYETLRVNQKIRVPVR